jgi:hypothetical protein
LAPFFFFRFKNIPLSAFNTSKNIVKYCEERYLEYTLVYFEIKHMEYMLSNLILILPNNFFNLKRIYKSPQVEICTNVDEAIFD